MKSTSADWNIDGDDKERDEGTEDEEFGSSELREQQPKQRVPKDTRGSFGLLAPGDQVMESTEQTGLSDEAMEGVESQDKAPPPIQLPMEMVEKICQCLEELTKCLEGSQHTIVSCSY